MNQTENMWPKISIITISLNSSKTIERALKSVVDNAYQNIEYIVIDGKSTDGTCEIIEKYKSKISYYVSEKDKNIPDGFNKGIQKSTGDIIGIVSSDDYLPSETLFSVAEEFKNDSNIDVLFGNVICYDSGGPVDWISKPDKNINKIHTGLGQTYKHAAVYVSKLAYEKYGLFDIDCLYNNDFELMLRFYSMGAKFKYVDKVLGAFQTGGDNEQHYLKNISLLRDITIKYGLNKFQAYCVYFLKLLIYFIKKVLKKIGNQFFIKLYRKFSARFKAIEG